LLRGEQPITDNSSWENDIAILFNMYGEPVVVVAESDRARVLFMQWGVPEEADGILPPEHPNSLTASLPSNWTVMTRMADKASYACAEITLPQPRAVLH